MTQHRQTGSGQKQIALRDVEDLLLDWRNPRLSLDRDPGQGALLKMMFEAEALEELASSFIRNGYFWEEPIVVVPAKKAGAFVAVEGNRRLSALKLLLDPGIRKKVGATDYPKATAKQAAALRMVPSVIYDNRDEVVPYLGFRHITGTKKWDTYSKARYVAQLVDAGRSLEDIEAVVGDSAMAVRKLYQSFVVYNQIRNELDIIQAEIRDSFSLLEVALGQQAIKTFLGVPRPLPRTSTDSIVPENRLDNLRHLVSWVFGDKSKGESRVISDSRQISQRLAPVLADDVALQHLLQTRDLEGAYERSGGDRVYFGKQVAAASRSVERALGIAPIVKGQAGVTEEVGRLMTLVESLRQSVDE